MAIQNEPTRIQIPFADSGTKNVIPDTNSTPSASQAASWTDGFPPQCSLPLSAGGIPPARADFNGIFNAMSQSIRFGQEGGIWTWDAAVDYGVNRMVLGSDGLLYWSVAQSGPNVGGAHDPTTDNGTYWGFLLTKTPAWNDESKKIVNTEWVHLNLNPASIFVDPVNGSDANNGLTMGLAVKTIAQAKHLAGLRPGLTARINLGAGTYSENIEIDQENVAFYLYGNISVTGIVISYSTVRFENSSGNNYTITIDTPNNQNAIYARTSDVLFSCNVNINGTSILNACFAEVNSSVWFTNNLVQSSMTAGTGILSQYNSSVIVSDAQNVELYGNVCIASRFGSSVTFSGNTTVNLNANNNGESCIDSYMCSFVFILNNTTINIAYGSNTSTGVFSHDESEIFISNNGFVFSGTVVNCNFKAAVSSVIFFGLNNTVSGSVTGTRYVVDADSIINTIGGGANKIPGTADGVVRTDLFALYL